MKKVYLFVSIILFSAITLAQNNLEQTLTNKSAVTVGFLQGGGSLIGADFEFLVSDRVGLQIGGGYIGFGAGLNYHLKPAINSSFLSLSYWNQGVGDTFTQNAIGGSFVFRARKIFTAQLGLGFPLSKGPAYPDNFTQPPVMLLYSIGFYIPL